ncbi:unnamed protein product [Anisakis simplex]|uniref:SMP-LTD domain-containing protein n=1 Tax=Anisakis simplex TaxID=6269 RepID=A0A0M3JRS8_ANISI|nr:unnamed protein product [Anisakis simplex]
MQPARHEEKTSLIFVQKIWRAEDIDVIKSTIDELNCARTKVWQDEIEQLHFTDVPSSSLTTKAPALHWSNFPRDDELQVTFKFVFPYWCLLDAELEALIQDALGVRKWPYSYGWKCGVLLKHDAVCYQLIHRSRGPQEAETEFLVVRIGIAQHGANIVEVSGRIDGADLEDDSHIENAMSIVWPYLSVVLNNVITYFSKISLPFQLYILPIGDLFYDNAEIKARSFDLTQFLISVNTRKQVEFQTNGQLCEVKLHPLLTGIQSKTLADLKSMQPKDKPKVGDIHFGTPQQSSTNLLSTDRITAQHRGRRVSFGSIRCIPQKQSVDKNDATSSTSEKHFESSVNEFVDRFLDEAMKQALIT